MIKLKTPNSMEIAGQPAVITYVPELNAFRGKFLGLSGYCDFVSDSIQGLQKEGELSLREYLEDCKAAGIEPYARKGLNLFCTRIRLNTRNFPCESILRIVKLRVLSRMRVKVLIFSVRAYGSIPATFPARVS